MGEVNIYVIETFDSFAPRLDWLRSRLETLLNDVAELRSRDPRYGYVFDDFHAARMHAEGLRTTLTRFAVAAETLPEPKDGAESALDGFLADIDAHIDAHTSGHDAYVRAGAIFAEHEKKLRAESKASPSIPRGGAE